MHLKKAADATLSPYLDPSRMFLEYSDLSDRILLKGCNWIM